MSGLLQIVQFAYHVAIVELWSHVQTVRVLVEEIRGYRWCFLGVRPALEMKILKDGMNQLRLCQLYSSVAEFYNLDAQEVTDVALDINGDAVVHACKSATTASIECPLGPKIMHSSM